MKKLIAAFLNFANSPQVIHCIYCLKHKKLSLFLHSPLVLDCTVSIFKIKLLKTQLILVDTQISSQYRAVNTVSVIKTSQLMLYRETIVVCSEINIK